MRIERNKIKRLIRESYMQLNENLVNGCEIIILWNKKVEIKDANFYNIKEFGYYYAKNECEEPFQTLNFKKCKPKNFI